MTSQALEDIRVIDLCRAGPGMMATGYLADYGADVISVVEPGYAERRVGLSEGAAPNFTRLCRRNKRSILLSLASEEGRQVFYRMAQRADVIMESNRPGGAKLMGVDYPSIHDINPRIIYCSLSGFGQYGPYANIPGHDLNYEAVGGSVYLDENGEPVMPQVVLGDMNAAWNGCIAILMALHWRDRTGQGQFIDVAFSDGAVTLRSHTSSRLQGADPCYNIYRCQDGKYIALGVWEPWFWERMCQVFGKPEWVPHQRAQGALREEMFRFFRETFLSKPRDEWFHIFQENDNQVTPLHTTWQQVAADPHNRARDMILEAKDPFTGETILQTGFVYKFSETPGKVRIPPSVMGSHAEAILAELGYTPDVIAELRKAAVLG